MSDTNLIVSLMWGMVTVYGLTLLDQAHKRYLCRATTDAVLDKMLDVYNRACDMAIKVHLNHLTHGQIPPTASAQVDPSLT